MDGQEKTAKRSNSEIIQLFQLRDKNYKVIITNLWNKIEEKIEISIEKGWGKS